MHTRHTHTHTAHTTQTATRHTLATNETPRHQHATHWRTRGAAFQVATVIRGTRRVPCVVSGTSRAASSNAAPRTRTPSKRKQRSHRATLHTGGRWRLRPFVDGQTCARSFRSCRLEAAPWRVPCFIFYDESPTHPTRLRRERVNCTPMAPLP